MDTTAHKPVVIVCDDNEMIVELIAHKLERAGCQVARAFNGETALELAANRNPAAIVLDIMMPGLDGFEVVRLLKEFDTTKNIPLIIVSSRKLENDIIQGISLGVDEYLVKPFMPEELIARLKRLLAKSGINL